METEMGITDEGAEAPAPPQGSPSILKRLVSNFLCWWFGCDPDYDEDRDHPCGLSPNYVVPCRRCGAHDTDYADRVGDTRHNRLRHWLRYWLFRRWWPERCCDCGKRFGNHYDCLPF